MLICLIAAPLWAVMDQGDSPPHVADERSNESLRTKASEALASDMGVDFSNAITLEKELQKEMPLRGGQNLAGQIGSRHSGHGQFAAIPQSQHVPNRGINQGPLNDPLSYAHPTAQHVGSAQQGENAG